MAAKTGFKNKTKKPVETTLGKALSAGENQPSVDVSCLQKPIDTSIFGLKQVSSLFNTATDEVQRYITYECDIIYECRMCRSLYRSLANFILHKRSYCRGTYRPIQQNPTNDMEIVNQVRESDNEPESPRSNLKEKLSDPDKMEIPKKNLNAVLNQVHNDELVPSSNELIDDDKPMNKIALEKIETNSSGVFQTFHTEAAGSDFMKIEVMEIHNILNKTEAILGPDGKVVTAKGKANPSSLNQDLVCKICNVQFSTKKTLSHHVRYKHNDTRVIYFCPECTDTFANAWCVFRHLYKVHHKSASQIRKLRDQVHASAVEMKRNDFLSTTKSPVKSLSANSFDRENQWINDFESDNDLQMCGGCGKRFERKAALNSHSHLCMKRQAVCNTIKRNKRIEEEACKQKSVGATGEKRKPRILQKPKKYVASNPENSNGPTDALESSNEFPGEVENCDKTNKDVIEDVIFGSKSTDTFQSSTENNVDSSAPRDFQISENILKKLESPPNYIESIKKRTRFYNLKNEDSSPEKITSSSSNSSSRRRNFKNCLASKVHQESGITNDVIALNNEEVVINGVEIETCYSNTFAEDLNIDCNKNIHETNNKKASAQSPNATNVAGHHDHMYVTNTSRSQSRKHLLPNILKNIEKYNAKMNSNIFPTNTENVQSSTNSLTPIENEEKHAHECLLQIDLEDENIQIQDPTQIDISKLIQNEEFVDSEDLEVKNTGSDDACANVENKAAFCPHTVESDSNDSDVVLITKSDELLPADTISDIAVSEFSVKRLDKGRELYSLYDDNSNFQVNLELPDHKSDADQDNTVSAHFNSVCVNTEHADVCYSELKNKGQKRKNILLNENDSEKQCDLTLEIKSEQYMDAKKLLCIPCKLTFITKSYLMKHMSMHFKWYCFQCSKCLFMSFDKQTCIKHIVIHKIHPKLLENIVLPIPHWKTINLCTGFNSLNVEELSTSEGVTKLVDENGEEIEWDENKSNLQAANRNDPLLRKMIMEVIFGSEQSQPENAEKSEGSNTNTRPVRNRTSVQNLQKDFVYDLKKIDVKLKGKKLADSSKVKPIKIVKSADTNFKVVRAAANITYKKRKKCAD